MRRGAALAIALASVTGCAPNGGDDRSLYELERMVFVPASRSRLTGFWGMASDLSVPEALLVDRFEVTRADAAFYGLPPHRELAPSPESADTRPDWPAMLSYREAERLAESRGMRLLTPREWVHLAVGPRGHDYPWGPKFQASVANTLDLGMGRPSDVGTFERGKSQPYGCYDLLGNVWEWVDGVVRGYDGSYLETTQLAFTGDRRTITGSYVVVSLTLDSEESGPDASAYPAKVLVPYRGRLASAMGGSFLSPARETYASAEFSADRVDAHAAFHAVTRHVDHVASDLGARMGIEAEVWLISQASAWSSDPATRARLRAVGESWGHVALDFLEALIEVEGAPPILEELHRGALEAAP